MEHIAQSMSPSGRIDSAPRDFVVLGLRSEKDAEPVRLGSYTYSQEGGRLPLQFFHVEQPTDEFFPYIELDINSNHGNVNYTCLYRFRVHGTPRPAG
jgi:SUN domain-containing protein 1/2